MPNQASINYNLAVNFPDLVHEIHPTKNGDFNPIFVTPFSYLKIWWLCSKCGHEWQTRIFHRTRNQSKCPRCYVSSSKIELFIYSQILYVFPEAKNKFDFLGTEIDIFIENKKIAIEIDGYWHIKRLKSDVNKNEKLTRNNIDIIRIRDPKLQRIRNNDIFIKNYKHQTLTECVKILLKALESTNRLNIIEKEKINEYLNLQYTPNLDIFEKITYRLLRSNPENNITQTHPKIAEMWLIDGSNGGLLPTNRTPGSDTRIWWQCKICKTKWQAQICELTRNKSLCPNCYPNNQTKKKKLKQLSETIAKMYLIEEMSVTEIGERIGHDRMSVWYNLKKQKIKFRTRSESLIIKNKKSDKSR